MYKGSIVLEFIKLYFWLETRIHNSLLNLGKLSVIPINILGTSVNNSGILLQESGILYMMYINDKNSNTHIMCSCDFSA